MKLARSNTTDRRRWLAWSLLLAITGLVAAWLVAPMLVRGRLEAELRRRLGPAARFGALQVSARGLTVHDLESGEASGRVSVGIERAQIEAFPPLLVWRPEGAIRGVLLDGVRIRIRLPGAGAVGAEPAVEAPVAPGADALAVEAVATTGAPGAAPSEGEAQGESVPVASSFGPARALESAQGAALRALRRLAEGATIELNDAVVLALGELQPGGASEHELITALTVEVTRVGEQSLRSIGTGTTAGGAVRWQLEVAPAELRAGGRVELDDVPLAALLPAPPQWPWHDPLAARVDGLLELDPADSGDAQTELAGWLRVSGLAVSAPEIHEEPLGGLELRLAGEGGWLPAERRLVLRDGRFGLGGSRVEIGLEGALELSDDRLLVEAEVALPESPCRLALAAIPAPLLAGLEGFDWSGTMQGRVELRLDTADPGAARLRFALDDQCRFVSVPDHARVERLRGPFLHAVRSADGVVRERLVGPGAPGWVPLDEVSRFLVHAVLAHEDAAFFRHSGFAPWAIETALQNNLRAGRFAYGASTISMQLAKNLFLQRDKTLARKVREVLLTWWLEAALDKREILELYLNVIEYGPNVYGISAAADHYFGRRPDELSPAESAFLATVLPAPSSFHRQFVAGELGPGTRQQMRFLLERMHERERIDEAALQHGLGELEHFAFRSTGASRPAPRRQLVGAAAPLDGP